MAILSNEDTNVVEATIHNPIEYLQVDLEIILA